MNLRARRGRASRRGRERHVSVTLLVAVAVVIASVLMGSLTAQAVIARAACQDHPLVVDVAVSADIAPAVDPVGRLFNRQAHQAGGRCVKVQISEVQPAAVASAIDGQGPSAGLPPIDAWIPDSSLWVDVARAYPLGAQRVQPTGITVARSPLVIVMPAGAAAQVPSFNNSAGWSFLLPESLGGPPSSQQLRLDLPDPTQSAVGLAAMVEISRLLGTGAPAEARLAQFVYSVEPSAQFDTSASLEAFVSLADLPAAGRPVTLTTEQAVLSYDAAHPGQALAARYPAGSASLGVPELDYPYVVTSTDSDEQAAAAEFGTQLRLAYTAGLVRYYGFRSANGVPGAMPAADGLAEQPLQPATPAGPGEAQTALETWQRIEIPSRDLALMDVSSAMSTPSGLPGVTLEQELTQVADLGLALFPDSTQMGMWEFADNLSRGLPYKELVPVGPLPAGTGLISRREQIQQIANSLHPLSSTPAAENRAILAAYQQMLATYQPGFANVLIVLTAGTDNAPDDLAANALISKLQALYNPHRVVELIIVVLGNGGDFPVMQRIAAAGGGTAYPVTDPNQVDEVFFDAVARQVCLSGGCRVP